MDIFLAESHTQLIISHFPTAHSHISIFSPSSPFVLWRNGEGRRRSLGKKYLRMIPPPPPPTFTSLSRTTRSGEMRKGGGNINLFFRPLRKGDGGRRGRIFFVFLWDENLLVYYTRMTRQVLNHANYSFFPENTEFFFCHALGFKLPFPIPPQKKLSPNFLHIYRNTLLQRKILFLINVLLGMTSLIKTSLGEKHKRARYKMNRSDKCGKRYYGKTRWKGRKKTFCGLAVIERNFPHRSRNKMFSLSLFFFLSFCPGNRCSHRAAITVYCPLQKRKVFLT